jgi:hypothetical protein
MIEPRDDHAHETGPEQSWAEGELVIFFDGASGLGGLIEAISRPHEGTFEAGFHLLLPHGGVASVVAKDRRSPDGAFGAGAISFVRELPLRRTAIRCRDTALVFAEPAGPAVGRGAGGISRVTLDGTFEATMAPEGRRERRLVVDESTRTARVRSEGWFEHAGSVTAAIALGERAWKVGGFGVRRRWWGAARASAGAPFVAATFSDGQALVARIAPDGAEGWLRRGDRTIRIQKGELDASEGPRLNLRLADADGETHRLVGHVGAWLPPEAGMRRARALSRFGQTGFGVAEMLEVPAI